MRKKEQKAKPPVAKEPIRPIVMGETEAEKQAEIVFEVWEQHVQEDAVREAGRKEGPLHTRNIEAQLQRLSDQVSREAQERREHPASGQ